MKIVKIDCRSCGVEFEKAKKEYDRQLKSGREHFYCSRSCSGRANLKNFGDCVVNTSGLKKGSDCDEYTPFRTHIKRVKRRYKEYDIDVKYLKRVWESQEGKCTLTGVDLVLENVISNPNYSASLDRIDSSLGYVVGNVQFISTTANYAKNKYSEDTLKEFFSIIREMKE